jgi:hypothetical protein
MDNMAMVFSKQDKCSVSQRFIRLFCRGFVKKQRIMIVATVLCLMLWNIIQLPAANQGQDGMKMPAWSGKVVAEYEDLKLYEDEFYLRLNRRIRQKGIRNIEKFKAENLREFIIKDALGRQYLMREAKAHGSDSDPVFQKYLYDYARDYHYAREVYLLDRSTFPPYEPIDKSPVKESEMRELFEAFWVETRKIEKIKIHYIFLPKVDGDTEGNKICRVEAEQALKRVRGGEDFVDVMIETTGSDLPSREPHDLTRGSGNIRALMEVVEQMRPGEISDIQDTSMGYYILYVPPGQRWTDLSSFEAVRADPESHSQLQEFALSKRAQIDPLSSYLNSLARQHGDDFEELDLTPFKLNIDVPRDAVLVRIKDRQWTYEDIQEVINYMDKEDGGLLNMQVLEIRRIMLMSDKVYSGEHQMNAEQHLGWYDVEYDQHGVWFMRYVTEMLMDEQQVPEENRTIKEIWARFTQDATDLLNSQIDEMREMITIHLDPKALDLDRIVWQPPPVGNTSSH